MKYLSRLDLEMIGTSVIAAYKTLPGIHEPLERMDIDDLVERLLGLRVDYSHLSLLGNKLGLTSFCEIGVEVFPQDRDGTEEAYYMLDGRTILVESDLIRDGANVGRRNYTVAHEGCHHIMRRMFPHENNGTTRDRKICCYYRGRYGIRNWEEWQVETLAGIILLPAECVMRGMVLVGLGTRIRLLNRVFAPEVYDKFVELAVFLGASKMALAIRMEQLGLLGRNELKNPYAMIDIEADGED